MPALKTLPLTASPTFPFPTSSIRAASDIMTISIVWLIDTPSGRSPGKNPKTTTSATPNRKARTERFAAGRSLSTVTSIPFRSSSGRISPTATRRLYSASSSSSLPTWFSTNAAKSIDRKAVGTQTISTVPSSIPLAPSRSWLISAAVAALTGLQVIPSEAAITLRLSGRSGRILLVCATSEMIGSRE